MASASSYTQANNIAQLHTDLGADKLLILGMTCVERLSEPFAITVEAFSPEPQPIHTLLGTNVTVSVASANASYVNRFFNGALWEYSELHSDIRGYFYQLVLRPDTEFMTLNKRNRVFQQQSSVDIAKALLLGTFDARLQASYDPLEYCVQYQESDFDFVSRLLEFEGIYYFYEHLDGSHQIVLVDDRNTHEDLAPASVKVQIDHAARAEASAWSVTERRSIGPAKVTVADYDFEAPATQLLKSKAAAKVLGTPADRSNTAGEGSAGDWAAKSEVYDFPARFTSKSVAAGERYSGVWLDAHRRRMARSFAESSLFSAAVGRRLTLEFDEASSEYLIVGTTHHYTAPPYDTSGGGEESYQVTLELMPAAEQYRPALRTPRPRIPGPQTAIVVGPSGEEIYTDKYGRIKVQFFWDREGQQDENSSCFIRVVQSVAGQAWGSFSLPRMGQEVVVEFMDGDPDRPIVTGAVYNGTNNAPVTLPDHKTQHGLKTRITKGGGGYNHYWFEDKKGEEVVWFRAERDYKAHIVNKDEERQYDKGNRKTTFMEGNDELIISKGTRTETIQSDDTKTIKEGGLKDTVELGDETHIVKTGKRTTTINDNETLEVKMGNRAATIKMGNDSLKVSLGNIETKADVGKITTDAMQSIELICGPSSIKIDPMGVTIKGMMIKVEATAMLETKGMMAQHSADAMQIIKGALVMIN